MAESIITQLSGKLECMICHQTLFNPRNLPCHHSFCQTCLDNIITFKKNGSGRITCPMNNCPEVVNVGVTESVSTKLGVNYTTQNVLDFLRESKQS